MFKPKDQGNRLLKSTLAMEKQINHNFNSIQSKSLHYRMVDILIASPSTLWPLPCACLSDLNHLIYHLVVLFYQIPTKEKTEAKIRAIKTNARWSALKKVGFVYFLPLSPTLRSALRMPHEHPIKKLAEWVGCFHIVMNCYFLLVLN